MSDGPGVGERAGESRPFRALIASAAVAVVSGTIGYSWIEGWTLVESLYMTVITLSTVGFGEVRALSPAGKFFTIALILGGVATLSFAITALGEQIPKRHERRLRLRIRLMKEHLIVCGYSRMARGVVDGLSRRREDFCVIENDPARVRELLDRGIPVVEGDATLESVLERAGLLRARAVAALLPSDPDNLSIAMTASGLRPGIRILARSEQERSRANLLRAGAREEDVISPHGAASAHLLQNLLHPKGARTVSVLYNLIPLGLELERRVVSADDPITGGTLAEATAGQHMVAVAIEREGETPTFAPRGSERIRAGDTLLFLCGQEPGENEA